MAEHLRAQPDPGPLLAVARQLESAPEVLAVIHEGGKATALRKQARRLVRVRRSLLLQVEANEGLLAVAS